MKEEEVLEVLELASCNNPLLEGVSPQKTSKDEKLNFLAISHLLYKKRADILSKQKIPDHLFEKICRVPQNKANYLLRLSLSVVINR